MTNTEWVEPIASRRTDQVALRLRHAMRRRALPIWDSAAWTMGLSAATWLRYEGDTSLIDTAGLVRALLVALVAHGVVATTLRLYHGRYWRGSVDDALSVSLTIALAGAAVFLGILLPGPALVPRSVPATGALIALVLALGARLGVRLVRERRSRPDDRSAQRVIVLGAGTEGRQLVRSMRTEPGSAYWPVALLDDDPESATAASAESRSAGPGTTSPP